MAYPKQAVLRESCSFQEECAYLTRLIEQHKSCGRKYTTPFDSLKRGRIERSNCRHHSSANATFSKYKKVNVITKHRDPLVDTRMYTKNESSQSRRTSSVSQRESVSLTPAASELCESQSETFPTARYPFEKVSDVRSGRMYFNPNFLKANSSLESSIAVEDITTESTDIPKLKHFVHINPKVLAEKVKKLTSHSQGTQSDTWDMHSEPSGSNYPAPKSISHSTTELVMQNAIVQCTATGNMAGSSGTTVPCVPRKLSPVSDESSLPGPLMSISRTKLVRARPRGSSQDLQSVENNRPSVSPSGVSATRHKLVRRRSISSWSKFRRNGSRSLEVTAKAAKSVCSKYRLTRYSMIKTPSTESQYRYAVNKITSGEESKYRIDRRLHSSPKTLKKVKKYSLRYEMPKRSRSNQRIVNSKVSYKYKNGQYSLGSPKFANKTWSNSACSRKLIVVNKKLRKIGSSPDLRTGRYQGRYQQSLNLVRIGGVLYRTSAMKLTQSVTPKCRSNSGRSIAHHNMKKPKRRSNSVVWVRGNRFSMDESGKILLRLPQSATTSAINGSAVETMPLKRIDIGGVTFVQKSLDVLVRTDTHNARNLLSQAKQRSIALLTSKLKKSNQLCKFYHRFGKCARKDSGTCPHVHDPKYVAICKSFVRGHCEAEDCKLSHDVGPEKMPTCKYFLEGCCVRDNCPYLHVKVNAKAGICRNFLRGYCPDGRQCKKRHVHLCPEFEKSGSCPKGKYCPYPHKSRVKKNERTLKRAVPPAGETCTTAAVPATAGSDKRKRYYEIGRTVSLESDSKLENLQASNQVDSSDLTVERLELFSQEDEGKKTQLNGECNSESQMDVSSDLVPENEEPEAKFPELGISPAYIPLR